MIIVCFSNFPGHRAKSKSVSTFGSPEDDSKRKFFGRNGRKRKEEIGKDSHFCRYQKNRSVVTILTEKD